MQHVDFAAQKIAPHHLARGVAATMLHQRRIRPDQPGRIDLKRQIAICRVGSRRIKDLGNVIFIPEIGNHFHS